MALVSIGDQSQLFLNRRLSGQLRRDLERLTHEVSTGRRKSVATPITGDLTHLLGIRRDLAALGAFKTVLSETQQLSRLAQSVLENVSKSASEASIGMVAAGLSRSGAEIASSAADAKLRLTSLITSLNAQAAGRSLFAGIASDQPALAAPEAILAELETLVTGHTTASGLKGAIETWFLSPGGGYETMAMLGSQTPQSFRISASETVTLPLSVGDPALRKTFVGLALAAFTPQLDEITEQAAAIGEAGAMLIETGADLIALRADLGAIEGRLGQRSVELASEEAGLQLAEAELISVDPYDASVALEATATRLETLYAVTARLSRLNLADYLR